MILHPKYFPAELLGKKRYGQEFLQTWTFPVSPFRSELTQSCCRTSASSGTKQEQFWAAQQNAKEEDGELKVLMGRRCIMAGTAGCSAWHDFMLQARIWNQGLQSMPKRRLLLMQGPAKMAHQHPRMQTMRRMRRKGRMQKKKHLKRMTKMAMDMRMMITWQ